MEGKSFKIDVFVDEKITCQLFVKENDMNLSLMEAKKALLEDVFRVCSPALSVFEADQ